ncbi:MAG: hypothetical protein L3J57_15660, partial [Desulfuromusa sp.]|nr:hypothetical protein [Desulfuromusa sp.]
ARFDEGGLVEAVMEKLFRHRQTKGAETDKLNLTLVRPALYSTFIALTEIIILRNPHKVIHRAKKHHFQNVYEKGLNGKE